MSYKVKEVSNMVGISVRTLHYYDQIGLLKSDTITAAGYRLYTEKDLEKLQQILFFKELDFSLKEIKNIIENPGFDRKHALNNHKNLLLQKKERLEKIIDTLEKTINSIDGGKEMDKKEMFNGFDISEIENYKVKYAKEVREKYGNSEAYKENKIKTSKYTKEDWNNIMASGNLIFEKLSKLMDKPKEFSEVQDVIEEWRRYITNNFYNCTPEIFRGLGQMYIYDERFTNFINEIKPELAKFFSEAIEVYCDNIDKK
ncbi:MerR family transcriptional regulator [Clostridium weizhouense]|uniref:MerR family transcriptional regulator n=1 Tax=Clostridium weizhouense TaxID=2859781 RepID=A0ABS7AQA5_9CLOT|nr:MerR family transcriptional regulator [Clostridium weizhouense]MBW6410734.1 MerR family transcriptional regulator [Clostridium weizhouense]